MKLSDLGEFGLIKKIRDIFPVPEGKVIKGIGDDCAVVDSSDGRVLLYTTDVLMEEVHFRVDQINPVKLGRKAMAVNISDIAAMGGIPLYAFIALAVPESLETSYIDDIISGIKSISAEHGIAVIGGDTSSSLDRIMINIFIVGEASKDGVLYRSGSGPGQVIFITGDLGSSAAGLDVLSKGIKSEKYRPLVYRHLTPNPQVKEGNLIGTSGMATSLTDISDGLVSDLRNICDESGVGAVIREEYLPISADCKDYCADFHLDPVEFALYGGEEYVLLGTVPEHFFYKLRDLMKSKDFFFAPIGKTRVKGGISFQDKKGETVEIEIYGYDHFKKRSR